MLCYHCMREKGSADICPYCHSGAVQIASPHHLPPGTVIANRYILGRVLGEGGFGITYIGFDRVLDVPVAVKEYYPYGLSQRSCQISTEVSLCDAAATGSYEKGKERFLSEAKNIAKFRKEPGIVDVSDFIQQNNTAYIVMEYLDGIDLRHYLSQRGVITAAQALALLMPVMRSLEKIHRAGIIHRDISPDNIMYLHDGSVKLTDFGAARVYSADNRSISVMLKHGFAPYEQYRRNGEQGPWTDVYAMCATIYRCITGTTPVDSIDRELNDTLQRPSEMGVPISPQLENVLMYGLAVRWQERCQSMTELLSLITDVQESAGIAGLGNDAEQVKEPRPQGAIRPQKERSSKRSASAKVPLIIVAVAFLLLIGGVLTFFMITSTKDQNIIQPSKTAFESAAEAADADTSQPEDQPSVSDETEPAEEYTEQVYSDENELLRTTVYSSSGVPHRETNYLDDHYIANSLYDNEGKIILRELYAPDGSLVTKRSFEYDSNGNIIMETKYDADETTAYEWSMNYDDNGFLIQGVKYSSDGRILGYRTCEYDPNGNAVQETFYDDEMRATTYLYYLYDFEGRRIKQSVAAADDAEAPVWESECDSDKRLWRCIELDEDRNVKSAYYFDTLGNTIGYLAYSSEGEVVSAL